MKDIIITGRRIKTELLWLVVSFVIANLFNAWAIWEYNAPAVEMVTSFFYVLVFSIFIYIVTIILRLIVAGVSKLISRRK